MTTTHAPAWHVDARRLHRWRTCGRKVRHQTFTEATAAARVMRRKKGVDLAIYHCRHCDGYHLGKTKETT